MGTSWERKANSAICQNLFAHDGQNIRLFDALHQESKMLFNSKAASQKLNHLLTYLTTRQCIWFLCFVFKSRRLIHRGTSYWQIYICEHAILSEMYSKETREPFLQIFTHALASKYTHSGELFALFPHVMIYTRDTNSHERRLAQNTRYSIQVRYIPTIQIRYEFAKVNSRMSMSIYMRLHAEMHCQTRSKRNTFGFFV